MIDLIDTLRSLASTSADFVMLDNWVYPRRELAKVIEALRSKRVGGRRVARAHAHFGSLHDGAHDVVITYSTAAGSRGGFRLYTSKRVIRIDGEIAFVAFDRAPRNRNDEARARSGDRTARDKYGRLLMREKSLIRAVAQEGT